jgi:hypothetical protein
MTALVPSPAELHGVCPLIIRERLIIGVIREPSHLSGFPTAVWGEDRASKCTYSKGEQKTWNTGNFQV